MAAHAEAWVGDEQEGYIALIIAVIDQAHIDAARDVDTIKHKGYRREMTQAKQTALEFLEFLQTIPYPTRCPPAGYD